MSRGAPQSGAIQDVRHALVGRDLELGVLADALKDVRNGRARSVAVVGEAGIGKTRLLTELVEWATDELVLTGSAAEFEQRVPFAVLIDVLDRHLGRIGVRRLDALGPDRLAELGAVFPSLALPGSPPAGTQAERFRFHFAVRALLEQLSGELPIVLALDDVHWADEASAELLAHLLRRRLDQPVLLVLAYRPHAAPSLLSTSVEAAAREGRLDLLRLQPLGIEHADALLGDLDPMTRMQLFRESGGNPFYLQQLVRVAVDDDQHRMPLLRDAAAEPGSSVPGPVLASLAEELDRLSDPALALLRAAAVIGDPFEADIAFEVAELRGHAAVEALDELTGVGLVRASTTPRSFAFRHPIVCRAAYESIGEGWLLAAHRRAAQALRTLGEPALVIAQHVERSARLGDEEAIEVLVQAGQAAADHAPSTAARCYRAATRLAPVGAVAPERRLGLLLALASALSSAGRITESCDVMREALELMPPDASGMRAGIAATLAITLTSVTGRSEEALGLLAMGLEAATTPRERAPLCLAMAVQRLLGSELEQAAEWAGEAVTQAEEADDGALEAGSAGALSLIDHARGSVATAQRYARRAARCADRVPDSDLIVQPVPALLWVANAELVVCDFERAIAHAERGLNVARATGRTVLVVVLTSYVGNAQLGLGLIADAEKSAETLREASQLLGIELFLVWAWTLTSRVALERGDGAYAVRAAEHAVDTAWNLSTVEASLARSHLALADAYIATGRPGRARDHLLQHCGGPELPAAEGAARATWYETLVVAELALGHLDTADAWAARAEVAAGGAELPTQLGAARRARARVLLAMGRADAAAEQAEAAATAFARARMRVEVSRARTIAVRALAESGDADEAIEILESAHAELVACGATQASDEAARELRRLARPVRVRGPRGRFEKGVTALTDREREIADLICEGNTNKQIAASLFLSERTVENHVTHIFRKLGVTSRAEIAREIGAAAL